MVQKQEKNKKIFTTKKKYPKAQYKKNKNYSYFSSYKKKYNIYYYLGEKKPLYPKTTAYLHRNRKKKIGIFFKKPTFNSIIYPFHLNLKLINEYLKIK
uniref:Ymf100 n=1 Tax=Phytophthora captiosa TaxID=360400 RepID=A0A7U3TPE9_9STRA|nr:ymf100 [Phytophthora captiosa]QPN54023.1 ymf100 [Phytophthora captiosa]